MLEINPEIVCEIILQARAFHAKEAVTFPDMPWHATDDLALEALEEHRDDLTYQEVRLEINALEPDQQMELIALMWLGRGDFETEEWAQCLEEAQQRWTPRTAEYLLSTPLVADFMEEGLNKLDYSCEDTRR